MKITKELGSYFIEFNTWSIQLYCHLLEFCDWKSFNWITIRPIHLELEFDFSVANWSFTFEILGVGVRIDGILPSTEKSEAFLDSINSTLNSYRVYWGSNAIRTDKQSDTITLYRTKKLCADKVEKSKITKYYIQ